MHQSKSADFNREIDRSIDIDVSTSKSSNMFVWEIENDSVGRVTKWSINDFGSTDATAPEKQEVYLNSQHHKFWQTIQVCVAIATEKFDAKLISAK